MADIDITITIPDAWVSRVQDALNGQANKDITVEFDNAIMRYQYEEKGNDNWIQFAERAWKEHLRNLIKVCELSVSQKAYNEYLQAAELPSENVPENILT